MKATPGQAEGPFEGWATELKWDGLRASVATDGTDVVIRSSKGRDVTANYPELADLGPRLGAPAHLDGELVVFDGDRPSFNRVLHRLNVAAPTERLVAEHPVVFVAFDLVRFDGHDLVDLPYLRRREVLAEVVEPSRTLQVPPHALGDPSDLLALATDRNLEGIVMKRVDGPYRPGVRSTEWRKVKIRLRQEFVVGGWLPGHGYLEDGIGSLVLGIWQDSKLVVAGLAGSGLSDVIRDRLTASFQNRATAPFVEVPPLDRRPRWVEPTVVVEVEFADWPADGMLRHPAFVTIRDDADPRDIGREVAPPTTGREVAPPKAGPGSGEGP
jgi:bifunctional non-homologous end joining protein LigD